MSNKGYKEALFDRRGPSSVFITFEERQTYSFYCKITHILL
jgi:hypothetical protein